MVEKYRWQTCRNQIQRCVNTERKEERGGFPGWTNKFGTCTFRGREAPSSAWSPGPNTSDPALTLPLRGPSLGHGISSPQAAAPRSSASVERRLPPSQARPGQSAAQSRPLAQLRPGVPRAKQRATPVLASAPAPAPARSRLPPADAARGPPPPAGRCAPDPAPQRPSRAPPPGLGTVCWLAPARPGALGYWPGGNPTAKGRDSSLLQFP